MIRKSLLALAAIAATGLAQAATYSFTGTLDLNSSATLTGTFSISDADAAAALAGTLDAPELTGLSFIFQGQTFTLAQASGYTPYAQFEGGAILGPNAMFNFTVGSNAATVALQSFFGSSYFTYEVAGSNAQLGDLTVSAVPEPQTWALLLGGLGAVGLLARRRKI